MAGLVGVLRQLGDLAEFAAEIFHGLHEEVMVTATRGHGLLVRVQQLESDFPSIERAFLSQTGHSAFFTSSGIGWHPNLQTEQNLITKGDLPRFVMDSYEECRGPPRLFLLDKFDVAGAGACLKRYTDPSFYKVEASSFEMRNTEAHRDKNVRKTKKKASRWKNGETPDVFQPSHVKLHQLLLEERMQNATSQPARHVKLKKREIKFPFDTETGKGYMETLLTSPIEEKRVHEVSMVNLPTQNGSIDMEHIDNTPEDLPEPLPENLPEVYSEIEEEVEEKLISVDQNHKSNDVVSDGDETDDVASEGENYVDALGTMESEIETETETRGNSDPSTEQQIQSQFSDSHELSEEEKIASFTCSDTSSNDNSPRGVNSDQAFASTEIPFRPRVSPNVSMDGGVVLEESGSKLESSNCVDVDNSERIEESEIVPEGIKGSIIDDQSLSNRESEVDNEDGYSNSALELLQVEGQIVDPSMEEVGVCDEDVKNHSEEITDGSDSLVKWESTNDFLESKSDAVLSSSEDETEMELNERKAELFELESEAVKVDDNEDDGNTKDNLDIVEEEKELMEREQESVVAVADVIDSNENKDPLTFEETELEEKEVEKDEDYDDVVVVLDSNEKKELSEESVIPTELDSIPSLELTESGEKKELEISTELDSVPSESHDYSIIQFLDTIPTNENNVENINENIFVTEKKVENGDLQPDLDFQIENSVPSTQPNTQILEDSDSEVQTSSHPDIITPVLDQDVESKSINQEKFEDPIPIESTTPVVATNESTLPILEEPSMVDLPQLNSQSQMNPPEEVNYPIAPMFPSITILPQLSPPINLEEMPPLPPLPPMQWRMGKLPNISSIPSPNEPQLFPQQPPLDQFDENKSQRDDTEENESSSQVLETESSSRIEENGKELKLTKEQIAQQPPLDVIKLQSEIVSTSGDDERPNGIRPMKVQRPRTPLIDAVAAHDKSKLRKVSERARPPVAVQEEEERDTLLPLRKVSERAQIPKEEERDTLLEQIRAKSFNLKPAVQTRPSIQGPSTNLRVAAILEKANAIRQAFAGSDDDEDDDSWSDS